MTLRNARHGHRWRSLAVAWLVITGIMLLEGLPFRPHTMLGWVVFVLVAPAVFVVFEATE